MIYRLENTIEFLLLFNRFTEKFLWFNFREFSRFFQKIRDVSSIYILQNPAKS